MQSDWTQSPSDDWQAAHEMPPLCRRVAWKLLHDSDEYRRHSKNQSPRDGLADFLFFTPKDSHSPHHAFKHLRWGGQCLFASHHHKQVAELSERYRRHGFVIEQGPISVRDGRWPIPFLSRKVHSFLARKIDLLEPGETTNRFTYHVKLAHHSDPREPIIVQKEIPSRE
ncbi:MAG TPA: hypothetical protein VKK61_06330, partial [Tepidisphaeraceae bacterium]|nr:hypothetical protein [Tepidisphaeraceae bacterium]